jgi:hypothetical protein
MRRLPVFIANGLLFLFMSVRSRFFPKACRDIEKTQKDLLFKMLGENRDTLFGRDHGFSSVRDISGFRSSVPISTYEDYEGYIEAISRGEKKVLTRDPVLLFEPTGGSTAPTKLIPYTQSLHDQFQKGISAWLRDLYGKRKRLLTGGAYWQISPVWKSGECNRGMIPVGFREDAEYLGPVGRFLVRLLMPVPAEVSEIGDIEGFQYVTLLFLLAEKDLALISVWNPTFLTLLLDPVGKWHPFLVRDIAQGTISPPKEVPGTVIGRLSERFRRNRKRAEELERIFSSTCFSFEEVWPNLSLISCWGDSWSASHLGEIRRIFPNVCIRKKGLISTEAFVSFPVEGKDGHVLSIESHFFEFLECGTGCDDSYGNVRTAWEIEEGRRYSVIVTTGGGLYRYRLFDLIEVVGFHGKVPLIRFLGKEDIVSDLRGEKLNGLHVSKALDTVFERYSLTPLFAMLAPEQSESGESYYTLFLEPGDDAAKTVKAPDMADALEAELKKNFHYGYCRHLGQLGHVRIFLIRQDGQKAVETYLLASNLGGQSLGDIKTGALSTVAGWASKFEGRFI